MFANLTALTSCILISIALCPVVQIIYSQVFAISIEVCCNLFSRLLYTYDDMIGQVICPTTGPIVGFTCLVEMSHD